MNYLHKNQQTIVSSIKASGIGIHSGEIINVVFRPAKIDSGIVFRRTDIKNKNNIIKANFKNVSKTNLGTSLINKDNVNIETVEHFVSALWGLGISNLIIDVDNFEMPILDGSSEPFMFILKSAGIEKQDKAKKFLQIMKKIEVEQGDMKCFIEPAENFTVLLDIDFKSKAIGKQKAHFSNDKDCFYYTISRARTFGHINEVKYLQKNGFARGASLDNAIAVDDTSIINPDGLRIKNEFARHKILDAIGDLYLVGMPIIGKFTGIKSGHNLNNQLLRKVFSNKENYQII